VCRRVYLLSRPTRRPADAYPSRGNRARVPDASPVEVAVKRTIFSSVLVASPLFLIGCSSSYVVSSSPDGDPSFNTFNTDTYDRSVVVVFRDHRELDARNIVASTDSTCFLNETTGSTTVVPTHTVKEVIFRSHGAGFVDGLLWGGGFGAILGAVGGLASGEGGGGAVFVAVAVGASTGLIGGLVGLGIGHRYEYQFPATNSAKK
jgi:hypothetical protein